MSVTIYRLQNEYNQGPYCNELIDDISEEILLNLQYGRGCYKQLRPINETNTELQKAYEENKIFNGSPYVFGFESIDQLYKWFSPVQLGILFAKNIQIYIYKVKREDVLYGNSQVAFIPSDSYNILNSRCLRRFNVENCY